MFEPTGLALGYRGTRDQLITAGLATSDMFPDKSNQSRTRKTSHPEQGEWDRHRDRGKNTWHLFYRHEPFDIPEDVEREAHEYERFQTLRQVRGWRDDDEAHV